MKRAFVFFVLMFFSVSLFADKGILLISANMEEVDIYNGDEQIAMLGEGTTELELEKGKYTITLRKPIDDTYEYRATKKIFIGANSKTRVSFKLKKVMIDAYLQNLAEELKKAKIEYDKRVFGNIEKEKNKVPLDINYKVLGEEVEITVKATNKAFLGKGGLDIYFPQFKNTNRIKQKISDNFKLLKAYKAKSKLWHKQKQRPIISSYLLVEGWSKKWKKNSSKSIKLNINTNGMTNLDIYVRANILDGNKEEVNPKEGILTEQGYYAKKISIALDYKNRKNITTNKTINHKGLTYGIVKSPYTGKLWLDRNLGASRVCTSSTDEDCYGDLYQWGRASDGHEKKSSSTTNSISSHAYPNHSKFIKSRYDWIKNKNNKLWQSASGKNNPCPKGFRVPTIDELKAETVNQGVENSATAYKNFLKFPLAGNRYSYTGYSHYQGSNGGVWSSSVKGKDAWYFYFYSGDANMGDNYRAFGQSVRCLKD